MHLEGQVDPAVRRGALVLQGLHHPHGGAAQHQPQLAATAHPVEQRPHHSPELGALSDRLGELIEHHQERLRAGGRRQRLQSIVPVEGLRVP